MSATESTDVLIVGSGFGGSIAAYHLAAGGVDLLGRAGVPADTAAAPKSSPLRLVKGVWDMAVNPFLRSCSRYGAGPARRRR